MGYTEFLVGQNAPGLSNLPNVIGDLEDNSTVFLNRWRLGEFNRAGEVSKQAMIILDFITNELLRESVTRKGTNSQFSINLSVPCGAGINGVSIKNQEDVVQLGAGKGKIPDGHGLPQPINLFQLLNKIKHRNPYLMNFRERNGNHIFVICTDRTTGGPEGIYEFDVGDFCKKCRLAVSAL